MAKEIKISFTGDPTSLKKATTEANTALDGMGTKLGKVATIAGGFVVGSALTNLPGKLLGMAQAAADDEASVMRLQTAVENSGTSFDEASKAIDDRIKAGQDLAFSDDETRNALTTLISETGSYEEGMNRLAAAQDLARGANISLDQAAKLLGKTSDENTAALGRYGIQLGDNATAQDVLNAVDSKFGGQAATFAGTGAADMLKFKDQVGEAQEQLGAYMLPAVIAVTGGLTTLVGLLTADVIPAIGTLAGFVQDNLTPILLGATPVIIALGAAILSSAIPAFVAWTVTLYAQVAAWIALNASMLPIIGIAILIGLAIVGLYELWSHNFLGIQDITKAVIDTVKPYIEDAIKYIQEIVDFYVTGWSLIFETAFGIIQTVIETVWPIIKTIVETYLGLVQTEIETVLGIIKTIWDPLWQGLQATVETVMAGVDTAIQIIYVVKDTIGAVIGALRDEVWNPVWDAIGQKVEDIWNGAAGIVTTVTTGITGVKDKIADILGQLKTTWDGIWDGLKGKVDGIISAIKTTVGGLIDLVNGAIGHINSALEFHIPGLSIGGHTIIPDTNFNPPDIPSIPNPFGSSLGGGSNPKSVPQGATTQSTTTQAYGAMPYASSVQPMSFQGDVYLDNEKVGTVIGNQMVAKARAQRSPIG